MVFESLADAVAGWIGLSWSRRRRADKLAKFDSIPCGLRVVYGDEPGFSAEWRNGVAHLSAATLTFTPTSSGPVRAINLAAVDTHHTRRPTSKETWRSVNPDSIIVGVSTTEARLEWAFAARQFDWATSMVASSR